MAKVLKLETLAKLYPVPATKSYAHRLTGIIPIDFFYANEEAIKAGIKETGLSVRYRYRGPRYDYGHHTTLKADATGVSIYAS